MPLKTGIIVALSQDNIIGLNGSIPWYYYGDLKRFKEITINKTIIMGRTTFESIRSKPLPKRRNIVITSRSYENLECFKTIQEALETCNNQEVWFIGGKRIYEEALEIADVIDITYIPVSIRDENVVKFPDFDRNKWREEGIIQHEYETELTRQVFYRK